MNLSQRLWMLFPAVLFYAGDVVITLYGQTPEYWAGKYDQAVEANPIAYPLLAYSPKLFIGGAVGWLIFFTGLILLWKHRFADWTAVIITIGHAIGGSSWLVRWGNWGCLAAIIYIVLAAELSAWCWRQYNRGKVPV